MDRRRGLLFACVLSGLAIEGTTADAEPLGDELAACDAGDDDACKRIRRESTESPLLPALAITAVITSVGWLIFLRRRSEADVVAASFGLRFLASLIDMAVVVAMIVAGNKLELSLGGAVASAVVLIGKGVVFALYFIVPHALWGQTLGKRITGIQVVRADGRPISAGQAILRAAPASALFLANEILYSVAILSVGDALSSMRPQQRFAHLALLHHDDWLRPFVQAWGMSNGLILLASGRLRALHDYLANTVVVKK